MTSGWSGRAATSTSSIEEYEAVYWDAVRSFADHARRQLVGGRRHVSESEMKDRRRTDGEPGHDRRPAPGA